MRELMVKRLICLKEYQWNYLELFELIPKPLFLILKLHKKVDLPLKAKIQELFFPFLAPQLCDAMQAIATAEDAG